MPNDNVYTLGTWRNTISLVQDSEQPGYKALRFHKELDRWVQIFYLKDEDAAASFINWLMDNVPETDIMDNRTIISVWEKAISLTRQDDGILHLTRFNKKLGRWSRIAWFKDIKAINSFIDWLDNTVPEVTEAEVEAVG